MTGFTVLADGNAFVQELRQIGPNIARAPWTPARIAGLTRLEPARPGRIAGLTRLELARPGRIPMAAVLVVTHERASGACRHDSQRREIKFRFAQKLKFVT